MSRHLIHLCPYCDHQRRNLISSRHPEKGFHATFPYLWTRYLCSESRHPPHVLIRSKVTTVPAIPSWITASFTVRKVTLWLHVSLLNLPENPFGYLIFRQYYLVFAISALVFGRGIQYLPEAGGPRANTGYQRVWTKLTRNRQETEVQRCYWVSTSCS